ncbi:RNA recognition motif domain-containing protein [Chloroflexota bacterium]
MKIYAGNLAYEVTEEDLRQEFKAFGEVASVDVIMDKYSGRPKGFAFVEMAAKAEAEAAIAGLNGKSIKERTIVVNESRPRTENRGGGSYGDRKGSGYGGGRSGGFGGGRQKRY